MSEYEFVLGICHTGSIRAETAFSVINLVDVDKNIGSLKGILQARGAYIHINRNNIVRMFLKEHTAPWLLFIDHDVEFTPEQVYALLGLAKDRDVVAGLYYTYIDNLLVPSWTSSLTPPTIEYPKDTTLQPIASCGMGFTLISRKVLVALQADRHYDVSPWFAHEVLETLSGPVPAGEDHTFCRRATGMGFGIWGAPNIGITHYKTVGIHQGAVPP